MNGTLATATVVTKRAAKEQKASPGEEREKNWLPAPDGPMFAVLRLYLPKPAVLSGAWTSPPLKKMRPNGL